MVTSKYFSEGEFNRCSPSCSLQDMKQTTMSKLDTAREVAGIPFVLTSAYRSPKHDRSRGRSGTGAHTLGKAVDIKCNTSRNRFLVFNSLVKAGFKRIGVENKFIQSDDSETHAQEVIWLY